MGGTRLVAPMLVTLLALAGCGVLDEPAPDAAPAQQLPPLNLEDEPQEAASDQEDLPAGRGELAWAGYEEAFGSTSSQMLGTPEAGVEYLVRAACLSDAAVELWFTVRVDEVTAAEGAFGCSGTELSTPLGELPAGAMVTVDLTGEVELVHAASVVVVAAGG